MGMEIYILILRCGSLIECLPSMLESICSIPYMTRGREGETEGEREGLTVVTSVLWVLGSLTLSWKPRLL